MIRKFYVVAFFALGFSPIRPTLTQDTSHVSLEIPGLVWGATRQTVTRRLLDLGFQRDTELDRLRSGGSTWPVVVMARLESERKRRANGWKNFRPITPGISQSVGR